MRLISAPLLILLAFQSAPAQFVSSDTYTRYELLGPDTHQFKIYYEVTETRPGARFHFNPIREGSEATDETVVDLATGKPLKFEIVTGLQAQAAVASEKNSEEAPPRFAPDAKFIQVHLAHPVPAHGEYRIAIIKTYKDDKSYFADGDTIVFKRGLGIPRNSVVLPSGYEVVTCSVAMQVLTEADGRLKLSFVNPGSGGQLEVSIKARRLPSGTRK